MANLQNYNRYGYCYNNPLTCSDPSGYGFLGSLKRSIVGGWHSIWDNQFVRTVIIAVASYYSAGYAEGLYAEDAAATAGYAAGSAASVTAGGDAIGAYADAYSAAYTGAMSSVEGGAIGGAAGGFTAGLVGSDGNLKSAALGAFSGALSGGVNGYFGSQYTVNRVAANSVIGGIQSAIRGNSFYSGLQSGLLISSLAYLNADLRSQMIAQSKLDPMNDGTGLSNGMFGDGFKSAGGRWGPDAV
jgi:hypothetical protein